jgi:aspartate aminotransferase
MFSYTGLTPSQVYALKDKYHIYLLKSGRASICGRKLSLSLSRHIPYPRNETNEIITTPVSPKNVAYVARAIDEVVRNVN